MLLRVFILSLAAICLIGCTLGPSKTKREVIELLPRAVSNERVGVALAGGGSKAAPYAMGVLAAIADSHEGDGLKHVDAISSVSGGSYAAFFLFSKLLVKDRFIAEDQTKEFFADCIPGVYKSVLPHPYNGFPPLCTSIPEDMTKFRFQQFVRCRQDLFENDCKQQLERHDYEEYANAAKNTAGLVAATVMASIPNLVVRTIFDWPFNISPTRYTYREGIGTAYGLYPRNAPALTETFDITSTCNNANFLNCKQESGRTYIDREGMGFSDLRMLTEKNAGTIPTWFINTTASRSRSVFGWAREGQRDFTQYTLQLSPFGARSGLHGDIPDYDKHLDLLDAVTASAAFLDPNETAVEQPNRMLLAIGQHLTTLDWGKDIPNPNVTPAWRWAHNVLPFPLYYIDGGLRWLAGAKEKEKRSAYIRLLDGGNNDDLGAYTLIEAGMKHIFIADNSQDKDGKMVDLCLLLNEVRLRSNGSRKLHIPGLDRFAEYCQSYVDESEGSSDSCKKVPGLDSFTEYCQSFADKSKCRPDSCKKVPGMESPELPTCGYPILKWKYPVVLGCIKPINDTLNGCSGAEYPRVYLLKPALDLDKFVNNHLLPISKVEKHYLVKPETCTDKQSGVCEVAAYIADRFNNDKDLGPFPQHGTVTTTFASTGRIYGAYRELARWQMREALNYKNKAEEYAEAVQTQFDHPIKLKSLILKP